MGVGQIGVSTSFDNLFNIFDLLLQTDKRWMSVVNGLAISGEIKLFKEKLTEARELFSVSQLLQDGDLV